MDLDAEQMPALPCDADALNRCWFNVGPALQTVVQRLNNIGSMRCVQCVGGDGCTAEMRR